MEKLFFKRKAIFLFLLIFISILVFSNTLKNSFMWDDERLILRNEYIRSFRYIPFIFSIRYWKYYAPENKGWYRPIRMLTLIIDYFFWKFNTFGYHLTNVILHTLLVILIYIFIGELLNINSEYKNKENLFLQKILDIPFITALFFGTYPLHTEVVGWIKNRSEILAFIFFILSLYTFIKYETKNKKYLYTLSIFCFILSLFSKETAFTIPLVLIIINFFFIKQKKIWESIKPSIIFFFLATIYFIWGRLFLSLKALSRQAQILNLYTHLLVIIKTFGYYIKILVLPINLNAERLFIIPKTIFEPLILGSIFLLIVIFFIIIKFFRTKKIISFAIIWCLVNILPSSNIIFIEGRPIAEQRLYIPSLGYCLLLAIIIKEIQIFFLYKKNIFLKYLPFILLIFLFTFYFITTFKRNFDWRDSVTFWEKTAKISKHSSRAYFNLGVSYLYENQPQKAIEAFKKAIILNPNYIDALINLGTTLCTIGNTQEGLYYLFKAKGLSSNNPQILLNIGSVYKINNNLEKALTYFKKAIKTNPNEALFYEKVGTIYLLLNKPKKAFFYYQEAIKRNPYLLEVYNNLGAVFLKLGQLSSSIEMYNKVISLDPNYIKAYYNLGLIYFKIKKDKEAITLFKKTLSLNQTDAQVYAQIGLLLKENYPKLAIEFFLKVLEINPLQEDAYFNLGELFMLLGLYNRAEEMFQKTLMINPKAFDAYNNLAVIYLNFKNYKEAISLLDKAIELNPSYSKAYYNRGIANYELKNYSQANIDFNKALEFEFKEPMIYYYLAKTYYELKEFDLAIKNYNKANELGVEIEQDFLETLKPYLKNKN